jgi:tRNA nucleotidyltransferase (CCA-adding enzyme)
MRNFKPPEFVKKIISRLEAEGFAAFMVGGCVRDILLGRRPKDWDVTTSASPGIVQSLFENTVPTGERHGTVTVIMDGNQAEVTTFRSESAYTDHRRPDSVTFVSDLKEDLRRRDFTINAMAMKPDGTIIDYFGGRADLNARTIRCVGDARERFAEDALRMLRALRFGAELGFEIEDGTYHALKDCAALSAFLSPERIRDELCRILLSDRPETISTAIALGLLMSFASPAEVELADLPRLPCKLETRLCCLCISLLRNGQIKDTAHFLSALRFDGKTVSLVGKAAALLLSDLPNTKSAIKRALSGMGLAPVSLAVEVSRRPEIRILLEEVIASGDCFSLDRLAVNGDDLLALGYRGRELGNALKFLLEHVIESP